MKHKHADLIKAWADGAKIQILYTDDPQYWEDRKNPIWHPLDTYRIKPEPKPDRHIHFNYDKYYRTLTEVYAGQRGHLLITLCGETGNLKNAEVLK